MANEEQLSILKQGVDVWNRWRQEHPETEIELSNANLSGIDLAGAMLSDALLNGARLNGSNLKNIYFKRTILTRADLQYADLTQASLVEANLSAANIADAILSKADLSHAYLKGANLCRANFHEGNFSDVWIGSTSFGNSDLSEAIGLEEVVHIGPSHISTDTFVSSKGRIPDAFLRGCGLSDWEIEEVKLYDHDLSNDEVNKILYRMYDLRATQALQISPLFISYSQKDSAFVDKVEDQLNKKGVRFWRDVHDMKAGRIEKQIDSAISQGRTVLLILSEHSLSSDWVEHEVRTARQLEKDMERDVLCPVALDDSWKSSRWPKRLKEQIMEYNILDFSAWEDDVKFEGMFRKLIDGLELFYKG